jgi:RloB-like protein
MTRGTKPRKPISKKVQVLLAELQRRQGVRDLERRFLIVCEDNKSAPNYFEALKKHLNLSAASIRIAGSGGNTQPLQVVEEAISLKAEAASRRSGTLPFAHVWCVIDGDYGEKIPPARAKATTDGIELAISTKCFEYWILLHFEECDKSAMDCDGVLRNLRRRHLKNYQKGKCDFHAIVVHIDVARERAKRLRKPGISRGDLPEIQNPCSEIYRLIDAILDSRGGGNSQIPVTPTPRSNQPPPSGQPPATSK